MRCRGARGLISSGFQSAPLQHRSHSIIRPQAAALRIPKYANASADGKQILGFRFPLDRDGDDGQSAGYLLPVLPWVLKIKKSSYFGTPLAARRVR